MLGVGWGGWRNWALHTHSQIYMWIQAEAGNEGRVRVCVRPPASVCICQREQAAISTPLYDWSSSPALRPLIALVQQPALLLTRCTSSQWHPCRLTALLSVPVSIQHHLHLSHSTCATIWLLKSLDWTEQSTGVCIVVFLGVGFCSPLKKDMNLQPS